ncbi:MAG TPA: hypothetical protein PLU36_04295 [Chitinophagaceae bacterium]|nr:hypothetical protein [Chitinophagaceae bacterium]MCC6634133.1 hypothetical protein [Chitinophagaceae bacterium]HMZ46001.1 hypothetical protein [Chitinophagaceae bacterium]HNE92750.1 hypothetical protein [Chitinophagaceae bacterium]HNF29407.1 hypothetical protein [Chitinophagaceae bacterium]
MKKQIIGIVLIVAMVSFSGCKKAIEKIKEQEIVNAITNGKWVVSKFVEGTTTTTTDFAGWETIYYENGTFTSSKTGETNQTGTWAGNASNWTFTITFNATPPTPLNKLGGVWTVTRAVSTDKGSYAKTEAGVNYELEMTKMP